MRSAILPQNESERLAELYSYKILDTTPEPDFNDIVELASYVCGTPISLISLVDHDRQWFKARKGLESSQLPRDISFCAHTILSEEPMIIPDAMADDRFKDNPLVLQNPSIRFYAGFPLVTLKGHQVGSLCVIDTKPRALDEKQMSILGILSRQVIKLMDERVKNDYLKEMSLLEKKHSKGLQELIDTQRRIMSILGHDTRAPLHAINRIIRQAADGNLNENELTSCFELIGNELDATLILLDNLVAWGKSHVMPGRHASKRFMVQRIVDETFELLLEAADRKCITLVNNIGEDCFMYTSRQIVSFILRNLISNAIKFSESGTIVVSDSREEEHLAITVKDEGVGMSPEQLNDLSTGVLNPSKGTRQESGSGLGIALILEFLQQHGGRISMESEQGRGTSMTVYFSSGELV